MFLDDSHYHAASKLAHHFDGSSELAFQPTVFIFSEKNVTDLENLDDVRLIPLYPLCNISPEQIKAAAPKWAERIKTATDLMEKERRDLQALLGGFIMHRLSDISLKEINQLFGDYKMEDTQAGKDLIEIGTRQGREEGSIETLYENLVDLVMVKWGRPEKTWIKQLRSINDVMELKALYHTILHAKSRKQVKAAFDIDLGNGKKSK